MLRSVFLPALLALSLMASVAQAQPQEAEPSAPSQARALAQMVQEGMQREAAALSRSYALMEEVEALKARLAAEQRRAEQAEARLKDAGAK